MKVVIIEDEQRAVKLLTRLLLEAEPEIEILASLESVTEAVRWFSCNPSPDLAFFDIRLSDGVSFSIFEKTAVECPVIFTTAYDEYAIRAFSVNSIDYLLKPLDKEQVSRAIEKYKKFHGSGKPLLKRAEMTALASLLAGQKPVYKSRFLLPVSDRYLSIPIGDILYFTSVEKQTMLVTKELKHLPLEMPLEKIEGEIDPKQFFRVNRQFLVSYSSVASVHTFFNGKLKIHLRGSDSEVIISKEKSGPFKEWLNV
jgi:two-component system response regulator LytT